MSVLDDVSLSKRHICELLCASALFAFVVAIGLVSIGAITPAGFFAGWGVSFAAGSFAVHEEWLP